MLRVAGQDVAERPADFLLDGRLGVVQQLSEGFEEAVVEHG